MAFNSQERSFGFSPKKVNAFKMHLKQKLHVKCKINSFKCNLNALSTFRIHKGFYAKFPFANRLDAGHLFDQT